MSNNNKKRILDRKSYPSRTISTYSVIGAYLVDIYYNHLYAEAIKFKNSGKASSITEGYKHAILAFISSIDSKSKIYKPKHYTSLLTGINEYFTIYTSYSTLTIADCIDKITKEFIPEDYYSSLDKDQKRNILRGILINVIKEFTKSAATEFLSHIIDNHDDPTNIEVLKDKMIDLFLMEREAFYQKFLDSNVGKKAETVDKALAVRMQQEIKTLLHEKVEAQHKATELEQTLSMRNEQLSQVIDKYKVLLAKTKSMNEEIQKLKEQRDTYKRMSSDVAYSESQRERPPQREPIQQPPRKPLHKVASYEAIPPTKNAVDKQILDKIITERNKNVEQRVNETKPIESRKVETKPPIIKPEIKINETKPETKYEVDEEETESIEDLNEKNNVNDLNNTNNVEDVNDNLDNVDVNNEVNEEVNEEESEELNDKVNEEQEDIIRNKFEHFDKFTLGNEPSSLEDY